MNQEKIGKFIAKIRKEKNMTQQELADKLNVTDRAVGNWENGRRMPDVVFYKPLCEILGLSLNEFFAGEYLSDDKMIQKSEENIVNIVNEENAKKRSLKTIIIVLSLVGIVLLAGLFGMYNFMKNYMSTAKTFKYNWGIIIPNDFKEEYYTDTGASFGGDGERYTIYSGTKFTMDFNTENNEDLEDTIKFMYEKLNIPKDKQIDFSHEYQWKKINDRDDKRDVLYIIYDQELNKYYFYELFL